MAGCEIHLELTYKSTDSMEMEYKILDDTAIGLADDIIDYLHFYVGDLKNQGESLSQIIDKVKDYLGQENSMSRKVL